MFSYPALLSPGRDGRYLVAFRDLPGAIAHGDTLDAARADAADELARALAALVARARPLPPPSALQAGEELIHLAPAASVELLAGFAPPAIHAAALQWAERSKHVLESIDAATRELEILQRSILRHARLRNRLVAQVDQALDAPLWPASSGDSVRAALDDVATQLAHVDTIAAALDEMAHAKH